MTFVYNLCFVVKETHPIFNDLFSYKFAIVFSIQVDYTLSNVIAVDFLSNGRSIYFKIIIQLKRGRKCIIALPFN